MAKSSLRWYGPRVAMAVRNRMKSRLQRAGMAVVRRVRRNIGTQGPPHSIEGEYPHRLSGELSRSVRLETDKRSLEVRVVASAPYADMVERKRPFLRRTLFEMRSELRAIILGTSGGSGRYKFTD